MKENKLADLSMEFAIEIISLVKTLRDKHESIISNQIGRSGTYVGQISEKQITCRAKKILSQNLK